MSAKTRPQRLARIRARRNRRQFLKTAIASAVAWQLRPVWARNPRGFPTGSAPPPVAANAMGINFATGAESSTYQAGMRHWKNAVRESSGFTQQTGAYGAPGVPLNASGWPDGTQNFTCGLWTTAADGGNGPQPVWATQNGGVFKCGFTGSGAETVASTGGCAVSNVVQSGANTTFTLTTTGTGSFGYKVSNVTVAVEAQWAYLPAYNSLTGIDNPLLASSITDEAIAHYSNYAHIRFMTYSGVLYNVFPLTSGNRATPSNTQVVYYACTTAVGVTATAASPAVFTCAGGSTTFCVNGYKVYLSGATAPGNFTLGQAYYVVNASGATFQLAATSGGTPLAATTTGTTVAVGNTHGDNGVPMEWAAALCLACGCGMWLNCGPLFDSSFSYITALADMLFATVPAGVPIYIGIGDELWNGTPIPDAQAAWSAIANAYPPAAGSSAQATYYAYQLHSIATIFKAVFGSRFGTDVRMVLEWQATGNGVYVRYLIYAAYIANGWAIGADRGGDLWTNSCAPYMNTHYTASQYSNTIAQIQATLTAAGNTQAFNSSLEQITVGGLKYGLRQIPYEAGWGTNAEPSGLVNAGAAILDPGMTAVMQNFYQNLANSGAWAMNTFTGGIDSNDSTNLTPVDCLGTTYPISSGNSPRFAAILASKVLTPTRNVVTTPGSVVAGGNYLDTAGGALPVLSGDGDAAPFDAPNYGTAGQVSWKVWSAVARTVNLQANFTNSGSAGSTGLEWGGEGQSYQILGGGTPTYATIPAGTNTVSIGSINIPAGHSYVTLGKPGTRQGSITVNSLTF